MNHKNILMPEIKRKSRRPVRLVKSSPGKPKVIQLQPMGRQKNEAVGLILIGLSAFMFTLMSYLSGAKTSHLINVFTAWLGVGMYIPPAMMGFIGVQHFFDRPIENLRVRMAGILGMMLCGLALLGTEGGKLGTGVYQLFSRHVGSLPTTVMMVFGTLSSLIFALDILYKDFLVGVIAALELVWRCGCSVGSIVVSLLQMAIDAVKTTCVIVHEAVGSMREAYASTTPELGDSQLLGYNQSGESIIERHALSQANTHTQPPCVEMMTRTDTSNDTAENISSMATYPAASTPLKQTYVLSQQILVHADSVPDVSYVPSMPHVHLEPAIDSRQNPVQPIISERGSSENDSQESSDKGSSDKELPTFEPIRDEQCLEEKSSTVPAEPEAPQTPVSLDHHPIDKDLKDLAPSVETEDLKPTTKKVELPPLDLLIVPPAREKTYDSRVHERKEKILRTLGEFGIQAEIMDVVEGPVVSRFELKPGPAVKAAKITSLETNLAMNLEATSIRIEAPIYGKNAIGIEIPNPHPQPVFFYDLVKNECFRNNDTCLNLALGVTIDARPVFADLSDMPHLLIAGSTGSGKSVCINTIIASILYQASAEQVKMVMIDPKMVELSSYNGIPHLISPVVTDPKKASAALLWAVEEMTRRYSVMARCEVKKITVYNQELERLRKEVDPTLEPMPYMVIIIDELADLMMTAQADVENSITRLAQMARAVGMHLVIATQRPSVDVLTGIIKANLPSRIAFAVTSQIDSRTILDGKGAESLLGKGDMLFVPKGKKPIRVQGAFISDRELQNIIAWVKQQGAPNYIDIAPTSDDDEDGNTTAPESEDSDEDTRLLSTIQEYLQTQEKTSTSMLQRRFRIGYNRAARIMDLLEEKGLVSPADGSNKRRVLGKRSISQA